MSIQNEADEKVNMTLDRSHLTFTLAEAKKMTGLV